jgi:hypothetical protein
MMNGAQMEKAKVITTKVRARAKGTKEKGKDTKANVKAKDIHLP